MPTTRSTDASPNVRATLAIGYTFDDLAFILTGRHNTTPYAYEFSRLPPSPPTTSPTPMVPLR
jgi:hypothetical protein